MDRTEEEAQAQAVIIANANLERDMRMMAQRNGEEHDHGDLERLNTPVDEVHATAEHVKGILQNNAGPTDAIIQTVTNASDAAESRVEWHSKPL